MGSPGIPVVRVAAALLLLGLTACVETSVYEKTAAQLEQASRASQQKDQQLRALEWQVVTLGQQFRESAARSEAMQREIWAQLQQASAANATLTEQLKKAESDRTSLAVNVAAEAAGGAKGKPPAAQLRPEDLRRLLAALDARNNQLLERINHLEQLIQAHPAGGATLPFPRPEGGAPRHEPGPIDVVDPWGFGSRK
jgi:septal ring factor EnvC (AmiA/AmiB activator)